MRKIDIPYYSDFLSPELFEYLKKQRKPVSGVKDLTEVADIAKMDTAHASAKKMLETPEALQFLCELYDQVKTPLAQVLNQRKTDRIFIDQRTRACHALNQNLHIDFLDPLYQTVIGHEDARGRIVVGPKQEYFCKRGHGKPVAPIPEYLNETHVTLFGPPDDAKLSINAMNAFHRKLKDEPAIVGQLLEHPSSNPKWGADDEDSKTPLHRDLLVAGENLSRCFDGDLSLTDDRNGKTYTLADQHRSLPIKRFPGLALPSLFLFHQDQPLPLHLYDFALHLFKNWHHEKALAFYVPKLENEEEAAYIKHMVETAEKLIHARHPEYKVGSIRLFIVLENPRAIFRTNEIMDALYPYFAGASLGWHDYLASTARLFKEDSNYRIPVKADPNIVIKYIKASHDLLAEVVGSRGGIKIGGMYGVLPTDANLMSPSFQVTIKGFIKDVVTQLKRDLSGFWVAHPDFIRIGLALVEAWKLHQSNNSAPLETLVTSLLDPAHHREILNFIHAPDLVGLKTSDPLYPRSLLVADVKESDFIANHDPEEIRYNVFQTLQYLTDWLSGNGCVALPAQLNGIPVRVMDDLATAERSRWEVWHELRHQRFSLESFLRIAHEELRFIRKELSNDQKIVQVKWDARTEKWYPIAMKLMIQLMTAKEPVEFATELLLPFTIESIRASDDPWSSMVAIDPEKYRLPSYIQRFNQYFELCGNEAFARASAINIAPDLTQIETLIRGFDVTQIAEAAGFHGDIGENKKTLDALASKEQALVAQEPDKAREQLRTLGEQYRQKFGFKYLVSAQGKSGAEILADMEKRLNQSLAQEIDQARTALFEITCKRLPEVFKPSLFDRIEAARKKQGVAGAQITVTQTEGAHEQRQTLCFGDESRPTEGSSLSKPVTPASWFELASLSKTLAAAFTLEYFKSKGIPLQTPVNALFAQTKSLFRLQASDPAHPEWANEVSVIHLLKHSALNMHYVNGVPANQTMPDVKEFLNGNDRWGYAPIEVIHQPGSTFQYSGGGFLVLEHLIESLAQKPIQELTAPFFASLGLADLSFQQATLPGHSYAHGYLESGEEVEGTRKQFPAFAAGAMGSSKAYAEFLSKLTRAFHSHQDHGISHDTAIQMLHGLDSASQHFMGVNIGLGVFIAEAGLNRFAIHQGANDGFRCLSIHCFNGPNAGTGMVILCNADTNGVLFVAEAAQFILEELKLEGVDTTGFKKISEQFLTGVPQEEVVNMGYKHLIFGAFTPDLPEAIIDKGAPDPLADCNLLVGSKILVVSNQRFARAENLISPYLPIFDPELYGTQGKIMDSWESVRHNPKPQDELILEMKNPSSVSYVTLSTAFHNGNHPEAAKVEGFNPDSNQWEEILPRVTLDGHALKHIRLGRPTRTYQRIRVSMFPDGGFSRLSLYADLPETEKEKFKPLNEAKSVPFKDPIPHASKPLTPRFQMTEALIKRNWNALPLESEVDVANAAYGGTIVRSSNEHYGPAVQVISPFPPINMFDGSESARSRVKGHSEEVVIGLGRKALIHRIEIDFSFFVNNNPLELALEGLSAGTWFPLVSKTNVKAYAGNAISFSIDEQRELEQVRITVFPDGGMNRVRVFSRKTV